MINLFKRKEGEGRPVRFRWTILTMLVIFLTFSIFSYVLLNTFQRVMINNETNEMEELSSELLERFSQHYYPLTKDSTASMLEEPEVELGPIPSPRNRIDRAEEFTPSVSLTKGGVIVKVFDVEEDLIYETDPQEFQFTPSASQDISNIRGPFGSAISIVEPIYSNYHGQLLGYVQVIQTLEAFHEMTDDIEQAIFIIGIVALIFSAVIGWLLINSFVKPITSLTIAMEAIQENLDSEVRLDEGTSNNEFSKLASTYNEMVEIMQDSIKSQKQFVEDVSHELRTPVAIVEGHLKMLDRWGKDDPQILEESISASLQETTRMKTLVQEMLDLSRAQEVDTYYRNEQTNILDLTKQLVSNYQLLYPDFVFTVDSDIPADTQVSLYRNHLEQIFVNIIDNAVKYSVDRKEVHISLSQQNKNVHVAIQDFGSGIPEEDLGKIFNRFYRVDKARSREKGGTGLGLPIVKELIETYGGKIKVESIFDRGSVFRFYVPIVKADNLLNE